MLFDWNPRIRFRPRSSCMKAYKACSKAFQEEVRERETDRQTCEFLIENEAEALGR